MGMKLGNFSQVKELTPPRQFEVLTGRSYLKNLEDGNVSTWKDRSTFTIDEATGSFTAQTDYGNYSYRWWSIGKSTLAQFLCSLDKGYFMDKAAQQPWREVDLKGTLVQFKSNVIEARKCVEIEKHTAREMWEEIDSFEGETFRNGDDVYRWFHDQIELPKIMDAYDLPLSYRDTPLSNHFWDVIWRTFTDHLRQIDVAESSKLELSAA